MGVSDDFISLLKRVDEGTIREYIHMVNTSLLAKALKNIEERDRDKILGNMPENSAEAVRKMMNEMGTLSNQDIEAARRQILSLAAQGGI